MLLKLGVSIERLKRPARRALRKVENVYKTQGEEAVITSTFEGDHGVSSLHYFDMAFDVRKPREGTIDYRMALKTALGKDFDVVGSGDHYHLEYDPK